MERNHGLKKLIVSLGAFPAVLRKAIRAKGYSSSRMEERLLGALESAPSIVRRVLPTHWEVLDTSDFKRFPQYLERANRELMDLGSSQARKAQRLSKFASTLKALMDAIASFEQGVIDVGARDVLARIVLHPETDESGPYVRDIHGSKLRADDLARDFTPTDLFMGYSGIGFLLSNGEELREGLADGTFDDDWNRERVWRVISFYEMIQIICTCRREFSAQGAAGLTHYGESKNKRFWNASLPARYADESWCESQNIDAARREEEVRAWHAEEAARNAEEAARNAEEAARNAEKRAARRAEELAAHQTDFDLHGARYLEEMEEDLMSLRGPRSKIPSEYRKTAIEEKERAIRILRIIQKRDGIGNREFEEALISWGSLRDKERKMDLALAQIRFLRMVGSKEIGPV